jgi:hypothetical protein
MKLDASDKNIVSIDLDIKLNKKTDKIKDVITNEKGQIQEIIFADDNRLPFEHFIELFKRKLQVLIAGEVITFEDVWRFSKQTDAKSFEVYLDNVEQEGIRKGSKFSLDRGQKTSLLLWLLVAGAAILTIVFIYIIFSSGGKII